MYRDPKKVRNKIFHIYLNEYELEEVEEHLTKHGWQRASWARGLIMRSVRAPMFAAVPLRRVSDINSMCTAMA